MLHFDPMLRHGVLKIAVGNRMPNIEKYPVQDDIFRIVAAFKVNHHVLILTS